tara:strand:- start:237 stop:1430 length:1194 start_codon:yes stop_codon:yes gene_type:complete
MASIQDLKSDHKNARKRTDRSSSLIKESLEKFGAARSIVIDEENRILAGNGTIEGAKAAGIKKLRVIETDGKEIIAVKRTGLTEEDKVGLALADNRTSDLSEWDAEMLKQLSEEQDLEPWFNEGDLAELIGEPEKIEGLTDPDDAPEVPEEPITKKGDLYILGNHRLLCGDSVNIQDVERLMDGKKADMVFTDPPYNINYGTFKGPKFKVRSIENDNMTAAAFKDFCQGFVSSIKMSCNGCVYVFGPPGPDGRIMFSELDKALHCSTTIVWNKHVFTLGRGKYQNKYEPCWFGWVDSGENFIEDRTLTNVWDFKRPFKSKLHPTMKPVEIVENALTHASSFGEIVLDLFGGSGTTAIAAERLNRKARLMELDPKYCDVIVKRWEDFTGNKAKRVTFD